MSQPTGQLVKLKIECYSDAEYTELVDEFVTSFNPNKYTTKYEIEYSEQQPSGVAANAPSFSNMKSQELALEIFLDGTGVATGEVEDVEEKVEEFLDKVYEYDGEIHRNRYLRVIWGTLVFDCILKSADINYTLFNPQGLPLRAKIAAKFLGFVNDELREQRMKATSPDLTHVRTVEGKGRIDRMTNRIYKTPDYYIDIAQVNQLNNFRKLKAGDKLLFPPVVQEAQR